MGIHLGEIGLTNLAGPTGPPGNVNTSGSPVAGEVAFFTNATTITGDTNLTWDNVGKILAVVTELDIGTTPFVFKEPSPGVLQLGDANLKWGDFGTAIVNPNGNDVVLQIGPTAADPGTANALWLRAPDSGGLPDGAEIFSDIRAAIGDSGGVGIQHVRVSKSAALNIYSAYTDPLNFTAMSIQQNYIAIWNLSGGALVDTLLLITGEGGQGVVLTDENDLKGWGTGTVSGDHSWVPSDNTGGALNNQLDLGTSTNTVRTGYFGTSVLAKNGGGTGFVDADAYKVGGVAGLASFSGAVTNITVVNGIVTAAS